MGIGPYMSTATNARDMLSITNAFAETEDGDRAAKPSHLLNYYGISYGTFLGQTFASMFPENVGYMVLDGVVSPTGNLAGGFESAVLHLDGAIASWFIYCNKAGPTLCSYYTGATPKNIYERFHQSFVQLQPRTAEGMQLHSCLKYHPRIEKHWLTPLWQPNIGQTQQNSRQLYYY